MNYKPVLITAGEPYSIFLEIFFKSIKKNKLKNPYILIVSKKLLIEQMKILKFNFKINIINKKKIDFRKIDKKKINIIDVNFDFKKAFNKISSKSNKYIKECFEISLTLLKSNKFSGLINGPVSKKNLLKEKFLGITEYLAHKTQKKNIAMLIYNKELSVSPITTHLPLKEVHKHISKKRIINHVKLIKHFYKKKFNKDPKIAITGLNPHCESNYRSSEEDRIIKPAIKHLIKNKCKISGPFAADTIFIKEQSSKYDVIIGMYHDQVLTPIKTIYGFNAINITLGLPFIRISPDHGPNVSMMGKNKSNPISLIQALNFFEREVNIKNKKSLGQNFLIDRNVLEQIVNTVDINEKEILEIGPGSGNLTTYIIKKKPKKIYVIEKDNNLSLLLNEKFGNEISIINDDVLKVSEKKISDKKLTVFGNLPYNISTEIISKWIVNLGKEFWFESLVLMFQKEVADRIVAQSNTSKYGRLSILSNWKLNIKKITDIKPESFSPRPKIDSSLLLFTPKINFFELNDAKNLEMITRIFFSQRRKMLKKPFNQVFKNAKEVSKKFNIDLNLRPQNLSPDMYFNLVKEFENLRS